MRCVVLGQIRGDPILNKVLNDLGLDIETYNNDEDLWHYIKKKDLPEILIIHSGVENKEKIITSIKKDQSFEEKYTHTFICLTKFDIDEYIKFLRSGFDDFLLYPFREQEVVEKIKRAKDCISITNKASDFSSFYLHLFKNNMRPLIIFDENKEIKDINLSACAFFNINNQEVKNKCLFELLKVEDKKEAFLWDNIKNKTRRRFLIDCLINNEKKYLDVTVGDIFLNRSSCFYACISDVTELKEIQQELKKAYLENELIINSINSILIFIDCEKYIFRWNKEAENLFEIPAEKAVGYKLIDLDIEWETDKILNALDNCKHDSKHLSDITFIDKDGNVKILAITIYPIIKDSNLHGHLILGKDITEKKILESQLVHSQKLEAIGELAAGIAHEINTPVQYVYGNITYIKDVLLNVLDLIGKYKTVISQISNNKYTINDDTIKDILEKENEIDVEFLQEDIPNALDESIQGLEQVIQIVKSMRDFSHPGKREKKLFDVNKAIEDTVTISRNVWKYHSEIKLELEEDLPPVYGYGDEINQVFLNIIVNAAHAITQKVETSDSEEKGVITIRTMQKQDFVEIQIQDTGTGIPEQIRDKIFDPFFTTKEVGKGTGQGLYLAYNIVKKHNGRIFFESQVGKGTTFYIQIPVAESSPEDMDFEELI